MYVCLYVCIYIYTHIYTQRRTNHFDRGFDNFLGRRHPDPAKVDQALKPLQANAQSHLGRFGPDPILDRFSDQFLDRFWIAPQGPQSHPRSSTTGPRPLKTTPSPPKTPPRSPQDRPKSPHNRFERPQDDPKSPQDPASELLTGQDGPKAAARGPQKCPRSAITFHRNVIADFL